LILLWLWLLIFCPIGRPSVGVHPGVGAQRRAAQPHTSRGGAAKQTVGDAPDGHRSEGTLSLSEVPYAGAKPFGLPFRRLEKVTRCKSETASGNTRSNGYAPNPIQSNPIPNQKPNPPNTKKARSSRIAPFSCAAIYQLPSAFEASQNNPADSATVAGRVNTHANRMVRTVPPCRPLLLATMVPATPEDRT
jgi:hypothetical protein